MVALSRRVCLGHVALRIARPRSGPAERLPSQVDHEVAPIVAGKHSRFEVCRISFRKPESTFPGNALMADPLHGFRANFGIDHFRDVAGLRDLPER